MTSTYRTCTALPCTYGRHPAEYRKRRLCGCEYAATCSGNMLAACYRTVDLLLLSKPSAPEDLTSSLRKKKKCVAWQTRCCSAMRSTTGEGRAFLCRRNSRSPQKNRLRTLKHIRFLKFGSFKNSANPRLWGIKKASFTANLCAFLLGGFEIQFGRFGSSLEKQVSVGLDLALRVHAALLLTNALAIKGFCSSRYCCS